MKKQMFYCIAFVLAVTSQFAGAMVTGDDAISANDPVNYGYADFTWDYIYNYKNSSAVAVDDYWILTASHVADDAGTGELTIDSTTYYQQEIVYHGTADLALVRYDKKLPSHYPIYNNALIDSATIMVGFGNTGTVYNDSWDDSGSGRGTKRWGSQAIDSTATESYDVGTKSFTSDGFWMDFDSTTTYEAGVGVYDSGGGTFIKDTGDGVWKLAGINTIRAPSKPPTKTGDFDSTFSVSTQDYSSWINTTVPEPTIALFFGFAGAIWWLRRRLQKYFSA